jgi:hypothetical protein
LLENWKEQIKETKKKDKSRESVLAWKLERANEREREKKDRSRESVLGN